MAEEVHRVRSRIVLSSSDATEAQLVPPKHGPYDLRAFLSHDGRLNKETGFPRRGGEHRRAPSFDGFDGEGHEVDITSAIGLRKTLSLRRKKSYKSVGDKDDYNSEDEDDLTVASSGVNSFEPDSKDKQYQRRRGDKHFQLKFILCVGLCLVGAGAVYLTIGKQDNNPSKDKNTVEFFDDISTDGPQELPTSHELSRPAAEEKNTTLDETIDRDSSNEVDLLVGSDASNLEESGGDESTPAVTEKENSPMEAGDTPFQPPPTQVTMGPHAIGAKDSTSTAPAESSLAATVDSGYADSTGDTLTTFYAIADCPYDDNERHNIMPDYIRNLDGGAEFMVHLGDLQYAKVDRCREYAYREAANILGKSRITTFVLPGDNDINDCDDVSHGESMWLEYLHKFDERWDHSFDLRRWGSLDESFTFVHKRVLYFALNIVGGEPYSRKEKERRHLEHLTQIRGTLSELEDGDFDVMVLFGHAEPSRHHNDFFRGSDGFYSIVAEVGKPTLHLHGDL